MSKNKVIVHLMGHDYTLVTGQNPESVQRTAKYVDRKLRELSITTRASDSMLWALGSMTLADELFRAQDENTRLKRELAAISETLRTREG